MAGTSPAMTLKRNASLLVMPAPISEFGLSTVMPAPISEFSVSTVMPALVAGIHVLKHMDIQRRGWPE
jgi:hypothetical protein